VLLTAGREKHIISYHRGELMRLATTLNKLLNSFRTKFLKESRCLARLFLL
jgi:hypothetical protein